MIIIIIYLTRCDNIIILNIMMNILNNKEGKRMNTAQLKGLRMYAETTQDSNADKFILYRRINGKDSVIAFDLPYEKALLWQTFYTNSFIKRMEALPCN